jgi:tRNA-splicing ligase RtcB
MQIIDGIPVWGDADPGALAQIRNCARVAQRVALMADNHIGYGVPIGGVMAMVESVSPTGVGYDIGCGNKAVLTDLPAAVARDRIEAIMDDIWRTISFGMGRKNAEPVDHALFDDDAWQIPAVGRLRGKAAQQLGTVGSGNHYVDVLVDERDMVWIGVHFGSRGFGHGVATHYLTASGAKDGMNVAPVVLSVRSDLGEEYVAAMELAGRYAYAGRDWVCQRVVDLLGARVLDEVHNHHNFAWREVHQLDGHEAEVWVVRKGATPAFSGQRGFVGGSMGDISVILEGVEHEQAAESLFSTVHGAGRVMSRTAAAGKVNRRTGELIKPGAISQEMMTTWLRRERVSLRGGGLDEAPQAYRRLPRVLDHHAGTIRILHELRPLGVAMAGANEFDPYKD